MPHPQMSDPRTSDPSLDSYERRPVRGPWWLVGQGAVGAAIMLLAQGALMVLFIRRIVIGQAEWWDWVALALSVGVVVASVASIVVYARRG